MSNPETLMARFIGLKRDAAEIQKEILSIEQELQPYAPKGKTGTSKFRLNGYELEVQYKEDFKVDEKLLRTSVPDDVFTAVTRTVYEVDVRGYRKFVEKDDYKDALEAAITVKTAKPYFQVRYSQEP